MTLKISNKNRKKMNKIPEPNLDTNISSYLNINIAKLYGVILITVLLGIAALLI